jgi:tyrosine-protein kinase Etk/Wzc
MDATGDDEIDLRELLGIVLAGGPLIGITAAVIVALGALYAWATPRTYSSDALIQVEQESSAMDAALGDMSELMGVESPVTAEIELLKSRMIVGQVVDDLLLTIHAEPSYFPIIGRALARRYSPDSGETVSEPLIGGLRSYAWGGEAIGVTALDVPRALIGKSLMLEVLPDQAYRILYDGRELLRGTVGERAQSTELSGLAVFVQSLNAAPGTEFALRRDERITTINNLTGQINVVEKGKDSGILSVSLEGADPAMTRDIVNHLVNAYQRQNVERKSAEAEQTLEFLNKQLPELRSELETSEVALNTYRLKQGSADLSMETQLVLQQSVELETSRVTLEQKREEALQRFTPSHPMVQAIDRQLAQVRGEQRSITDQVKKLPETQQELLRLSRDVQVNTTLYTQLLNSAQELQVVKAGTVGNVRVVDHALTAIEPTKPKVALVLALSAVLGVFLGLVVVFVRRALHSGVDDPAAVENGLGLPTYCAIPYSQLQARISRLVERGKSTGARLLASADPHGTSIEALRSLRTALHFGQLEAKNNIVMLTGPSPGLGKSFVASNLGAVLAVSGKRIVVVDLDLRRGRLHEYFTGAREPGVSDFVAGSASLADILSPTSVDNLHFIPTGTIPPNPAELLLTDKLGELLGYLSSKYDTVIVDTPPVLAVTDAAVVGRYVGTTLLVLKAGDHPMRAIEDTVKRLMSAGVPVRGTIFNQMGRQGQGRYGYKYGYSYGYYNYDYKPKTAKKLPAA